LHIFAHTNINIGNLKHLKAFGPPDLSLFFIVFLAAAIMSATFVLSTIFETFIDKFSDDADSSFCCNIFNADL
jgi:hypothetical protein